ncbi:hypothetical protein AMECASPLE_027944 [Ameca splendens]|uniref:Uncharacterized protein n=1 Tax=Ameca splendens TaxID=208324 RepID=A0ABV0XU89_9TELE
MTFLLRPPEVALIKVDLPNGLEKKAVGCSRHRKACDCIARACPGSESYPAGSRPRKEPNMPSSYGSAGPAKSPSPRLRRFEQNVEIVTEPVWQLGRNIPPVQAINTPVEGIHLSISSCSSL